MNSKMLDAYVTGIPQLLDDKQWDEAERVATGLPHIAVALSNRELESSRADYIAWCREWIGSPQEDSVYDSWCTLSIRTSSEYVDGKPFGVLQTLSLVRGLRTRAAYAPMQRPTDARELAVTQTCDRLVAAFESWRTTNGKSDPIVTLNLAKLGVLR